MSEKKKKIFYGKREKYIRIYIELLIKENGLNEKIEIAKHMATVLCGERLLGRDLTIFKLGAQLMYDLMDEEVNIDLCDLEKYIKEKGY